jgi:hypothetical protein
MPQGKGKGQDLPHSLLKRVAEAASGRRNGKPVWFVADRTFPHKVREHADEVSADADVATKGDGHVKLGPYTSAHETPHKKEIEYVKVKVAGHPEVTVDLNRTDALFFSLSALDKFVYPYYTSLYGPETAANMRKSFVSSSNEGPIQCHDPLSDECAIP